MSNAQKLRALLDKELPRPQNENLSHSEETEDKKFLHIILTEEETEEAIRAAREDKYYRMKREEYAKAITDPIEPLSFTAEEVFDKFKYGADVEPGTRYEIIVKRLCAYFTNDRRCPYDPNKGLILCGNIGIGKTILMEFFQRNQKASYRIVQCAEIESAFGSADKESGGEEAIRQYSENFKVAVNSNPFGHQEIGYCFDDLGAEVVGKHYGKAKDVMVEVLSSRYNKRIPNYMTHIITNLSADQVRERYGDRVFDRLCEMLNVIDFPFDAKSRRK